MTNGDPIDRTHRDSLAAIAEIRQAVKQARRRVARWQPSPMPRTWQ